MAATNPPFFLLRIATSDQGWTNNEIFAQWFAQVFIPFTQGRNKSGTSILLIIDSHASHETPEVQQLCYAASPPVILYCLPPKTTHKLQLLDVGVFGPLQNAWAKHTQECAAQNRSVTPVRPSLKSTSRSVGSTCQPRRSNWPSAIVVSGPSTLKSSRQPILPPAR